MATTFTQTTEQTDVSYQVMNDLTDEIATAIDAVPTPGTIAITAGEALADSDAVYPNSSGKMVKAKADAHATAKAIGLSIGSINNNAAGSIRSGGVFTKSSWAWTAGDLIFLSAATAGALTQTEPTTGVSCTMGIAITATSMLVLPMMRYVGIDV
mgnify:FL=1